MSLFPKTLIFCAAFLFITPIAAHTFTNNKGKKINADIVSVKEELVKLKLKKNNKTYNIPISSLSQKDQDYIKQWQKDNAKPVEEEAEKPDTSSRNRSRSRHPLAQFTYSVIKEQYKIEDNFDKDWPKMTSTNIPEITIVKEDKDSSEFIYHSPNYEFICDVKLSKNVVKKFAHLFEATRDYCKAIPISMLKANIPDTSIRYKILLFESQEKYFKNGAPVGSAGVYMPMKDIIMVPLTSLGVKKVGSGYMFDYDGSNKTLPHEITHQLTHREYYNAGAVGWFTEGLAEYIGVTDYRSGKFMINGNRKDIIEYVTGFAKKTNRGRNLGKEFNAPDLKEYMNMSYGNFTSNGNFNYGLGCLITYYFLHLDKENGRKDINAFLQALNEGKKGKEALDVLLNGKTYDEMEQAIYKAWKSKGVKINFN